MAVLFASSSLGLPPFINPLSRVGQFADKLELEIKASEPSPLFWNIIWAKVVDAVFLNTIKNTDLVDTHYDLFFSPWFDHCSAQRKMSGAFCDCGKASQIKRWRSSWKPKMHSMKLNRLIFSSWWLVKFIVWKVLVYLIYLMAICIN